MEQAIAGFFSVFTLPILGLMVLGTVSGIVIGAVPGLSVTLGVALFLPLTYSMEPHAGLALLLSIYVGATSGGLISAVLLKIPGTAASVATCFDGHPMAERGEAGKALGIGVVASFLGGMFSYLVLMLIAPSIARVALKFTPFEFFALGVFSLTMIASLSRGSLVKGFISALLGMTVSFVGIPQVSGMPRFTFGNMALNGGFQILPVLIGLFAVAQVLVYAEEKLKKVDSKASNYHIKGFGFTREDVKGKFGNVALSSLIGTGIGILPGLGAGIANIIAYSAARSRSKHPEKFGTGVPDGIIASEAANNATTGGALVPLMTLGIPGDNTTAILLAGFTLHGIIPGPTLFTEHTALVYSVFAACMVANVLMLISEYIGMRVFVKVLSVPRHILMPIVIVCCAVGAFGANNRVFDIFVMLGFGVIGYGLKKFKFPEAPIILGFILGPLIETNLLRGLQKSSGSFLPFVTKPIAMVFLLIALVVLVNTIIKELKAHKPKAAVATDTTKE